MGGISGSYDKYMFNLKKIKLFAKVDATSYIPTDRLYNLQLLKLSPTINIVILLLLFSLS